MQEEDLVFLPGYTIKEMIQKKEISCTEVTKTFLNRIEKLNPKIHAYILILKDLALKQAEEIDRNLDLYIASPLLGIPISIKDLLFDIQGTVTTNGSLLCFHNIAKSDSLSVERLRGAKSIFLGKTNVPEFGSEFITRNRLMPPTANPWMLTQTAGGSSGGSAASVSAGMASIAIANDSAGSIRLPSSFCSLFGFMPSCDSVPFNGEAELVFQPLHRIGPISRTVKDAAMMLDVITQGRPPKVPFTKLIEHDPKPMRLAWSPDLGLGIQNPEIIKTIEQKLIALQKLGFEVEQIKLPVDLNDHLPDLKNFILSKFKVIAEKIPMLAKPILGSSISHILDQASHILPADIEKAIVFREEFNKKMATVMQKYPLLICPTAATAAFSIEHYPDCIKKLYSDPYIFFASFLFPFNFSGQPAASLPCGFTQDNLPIGLQVVGPENDDAGIFQFCHFFEKVFPWADKRPNL